VGGLDGDEFRVDCILKSMETETVTIQVDPSTKEAIIDSLIDWEYADECAAEADPSVTLEDVRARLSKISSSMVDDFRRERDER